MGESIPSLPVSALAVNIPSQPNQPTMIFQSINEITISWTAPDDGGSQITNYNIFANLENPEVN
jgi:Fibronectin type III domain